MLLPSRDIGRRGNIGEEEDPRADTRSGIDASWLVCRGAEYAPRLRSTPRVAQALLSSALSEIAVEGRSSECVAWLHHPQHKTVAGQRRFGQTAVITELH